MCGCRCRHGGCPVRSGPGTFLRDPAGTCPGRLTAVLALRGCGTEGFFHAVRGLACGCRPGGNDGGGILRALASPLPVAWVAADGAYGQDSRLRRFLEDAGLSYVVAVPKSQQVHGPARTRYHPTTTPTPKPLTRAYTEVQLEYQPRGEELNDQ
ncbi:transposase [Streptomyces sp. NPDC057575]|uniref:transposase n=1 Tax=unclassified Streptomyces TaxID=2593676 RepID=UPI0036B5ABE7